MRFVTNLNGESGFSMEKKEENKDVVRFDELRKAIVEDAKVELEKDFKRIETEEGLKQTLSFHGKKYKGNVKMKLASFLKKQSEKRTEEQFIDLKAVEEAKPFSSRLVVTIEYKKSRMWGMNPTSSTNFGFTSESVGGCGYDKQSTALAYALNSHLPLLKLLYAKKNRLLKEHENKDKVKDNNSLLGYGSGYNILPKFEGGVGFESHRSIIEGSHLAFESVTQAKTTDVFIISLGKVF